MTRKLTPGDRVRHKATGHEYTFHAHPSSQDFPGSRYVRDESGAIREFRADEIEAISTTTVKLKPGQLHEIEEAAKKIPPGPWQLDGDEVILDRPATLDDMAYLATMDPATTLALVAEIRELRAEVERVRHLHLPSGDPEVDSLATCDECSDLDGKAPRWPCPTISALGEGA